jgi:hypothetical protein
MITCSWGDKNNGEFISKFGINIGSIEKFLLIKFKSIFIGFTVAVER